MDQVRSLQPVTSVEWDQEGVSDLWDLILLPSPCFAGGFTDFESSNQNTQTEPRPPLPSPSPLLPSVTFFTSYCTVLYCTILYNTVQYCTVLYCTVSSLQFPRFQSPKVNLPRDDPLHGETECRQYSLAFSQLSPNSFEFFAQRRHTMSSSQLDTAQHSWTLHTLRAHTPCNCEEDGSFSIHSLLFNPSKKPSLVPFPSLLLPFPYPSRFLHRT